MDIQKLTHKNYRLTVCIAIVLSGMVVTLASLLGRGALQIHGALAVEKPTELTVAILIEKYKLYPLDVTELPKRDNLEHRYVVKTTDDETYMVRIAPDGPPWHLVTKPERLRE
jgi:hypothetical protein